MKPLLLVLGFYGFGLTYAIMEALATIIGFPLSLIISTLMMLGNLLMSCTMWVCMEENYGKKRRSK